MSKITAILLAISLFLAVVNITIAFIFWSLVEQVSTTVPEQRNYQIDTVSLQVTLFSLFLVIFSIILTSLAIIGYSTLREQVVSRAEKKAETVAREVAGRQMSEFFATVRKKSDSGLNESSGSYRPGDEKGTAFTKAGEE